MAIDIHQDLDAGLIRIRISEEMNIYTAATLKDALLAHGATSLPRHFDLAQVSEMDTAGLQLLLAALRPAQSGGAAGAIVAVSPVVSDLLTLCGLPHLLPGAAPTSCGEQ
ncbi:MAG TPA: STAS domain-containing protein [Azospira sp.]|nr:STAS domain-containing protein [Azospira sp.]